MNEDEIVDEILQQLDDRKQWALQQVINILKQRPSIQTEGGEKIHLQPFILKILKDDKTGEPFITFDLKPESYDWGFEFEARVSGKCSRVEP